jgi:hypothetical protein
MFEEKTSFKIYKEELSKVTDSLSLKEAIKSDREGTRKIRDNLVLIKMAWNESLSYFAIIQSVIIFTALVPNSIENINTVLRTIHIGYQFPIGSSSVAAILLILIIMLFGIISYRFFGLARRANEVSALYSPSSFLLYNKLLELEKEIKEMKK